MKKTPCLFPWRLLSGLICLLPLLLFNSCFVPRTLTIQVLTPPDTMLFTQEHDLLLINTMYSDNHLNDTLRFDELRIAAPVYNYYAWRILYGFADVATESPLVQSILFDSVPVTTAPREAYRRFQEKRTEANHTTVSARLDSVVYGDSLKKKQSIGDEDGSGIFLVQMDLYLPLKTYWDIYRKGAGFYALEMNDTMILRGLGIDQDEAMANLPNIQENIYDLTYHAGNKTAWYLYPSWSDADRVYYIHQTNKKMVQAELAVEKNDWLSAAQIWNDLTEAKNRSLAAHAAFNMAVAAEINDLLEVAEEWLEKSVSLKPTRLAKEYLELIRQRKKDKAKILKAEAGNG